MIEILYQWLPLFVIEARKEDGGRYLAFTINQLLWRAARTKSPLCENQYFMNRKDRRFAKQHGS